MSQYRGGPRMMRQYPGLWFIWSPLGRVVHSVLWRFPPYKRVIDALVARDLRNEYRRLPETERSARAADRAAAFADLSAGRTYRLVDRDLVPSDTWQADDPQQPDGWRRHDGSGWVRT